MNDKGLVFISYQQAAEAFAKQLREKLIAWGWQTWMDIFDIPSGVHWPKEIETGLIAADRVIAVMTPAAVRTESVLNEWEYAIVHDKQLIPLVLEASELPITLRQRHAIDFVHQSPENWAALESALSHSESVSDSDIDPYLPYLQNLYKRLNTYLAQKVINRKDDNEQAPNPLHLKSSSTAQDVDELFAKPDRIEPLFEASGITIDRPKQDYDDFESAFQYFEGQVLLLGAPGSGKTITLLQFARDAVVRRIQDPTQRLPMFAILPDWLKLGTPDISDWMAQTQDAPADAADLVRQGRALLLFDGLDELGNVAEEIDPTDIYRTLEFDPRVRFMYVIRKAVRNPDKTEVSGSDNQLVVTCRLEEYRRTGTKIGLKGAVILKNLDQAQIAKYLEDVPGLQAIFQNDAEMRKIAETPLLLSLIAYAFRENTTELQELRDLRDGALRDAIFNAYISQRYAHERAKQAIQNRELPFELAVLVHDLGWIAMVNAAKQNFASENVLIEADFWRVVGSSKSRALIAFCQQLNLITEIDANTWRFVHLKLRDTLAYGRAAKILKESRISNRTALLAGQANANIRDKRLISELLTNKEDQQELFEAINSGDRELFSSLEEMIEVFGLSKRSSAPEKKIDPYVMATLIARLDSQDADIRANAAEDLGKIRDGQAVDALIKALTDSERNVRYRAVVALGVLRGDWAVEGLAAILQNDSVGLRREAVESLGAIGNAQAVDALLLALDDPDVVVRSKIAEVLGQIGDVRAIDGLLKAVTDIDSLVREHAIKALSRIGNPIGIQGLIIALEDSSRGVRYAAATGLEEMGDARAINGLLKALTDKVQSMRDKAALALEHIGDAQVVQALTPMLTHQEGYVRAKVAETLGKIGGRQAVDSLIIALDDPDYHVRGKATEALGKIGDLRIVENILNRLNDADKYVRASAAEALGKLGDTRAIKQLLKALVDQSEQVCASAAKALGIMDAQRVSKSFQGVLSAPDKGIRQIAVNVLARICKPWTTSCLVMALSDVDENIRYQAAIALGGFPGNVQAVTGLANALNDADVGVRRVSARALGQMGSAQVVEKLVDALQDTDLDVRIAAIGALGRIGDADCLPQLENLLNSNQMTGYVISTLNQFRNEYAFQLVSVWETDHKE